MSWMTQGTWRLRTTKVSMSTPPATMTASWTRKSGGMTASTLNVAARTRPAEAVGGWWFGCGVQIFANLEAILAAAGAALTDVVRVGIVMRDLQRDRPVFNQVWAERFGDHRPARSAIPAPDFGRTYENARFMIEVAAYRG
jgi:hypothetical protein